MRTLSAFPIILMIVFLAAGCEPEPTHYWYNPMRSIEQARKDCEECQKRVEAVEAETATVREGQEQGLERPESKEEKERHGDRLDTLATWDEMYMQNVFAGCMGGKGYFKVETDRLPRDLSKDSLPGGDIAGR